MRIVAKFDGSSPHSLRDLAVRTDKLGYFESICQLSYLLFTIINNINYNIVQIHYTLQTLHKKVKQFSKHWQHGLAKSSAADLRSE